MSLDAAQIEAVVREQHALQPFSGVVQVRDRSGIVFSTALGFAHRAEAIPNVPSTRFGTASGTKTFTALGVCQLIHYNNGGFVLLGLVIEAVSGMAYTDYVEQHVLARAGMFDSGFFEMNDLPPRTAYGYLRDGRTNIYEVPIRGMPDGGAFVTAPDMAAFWDALMGNQLLGAEMTAAFLQPRVEVSSGDDGVHYGYGLWMDVAEGAVTRYTCAGADPGVAFVSSHFPSEQIELTVLGNSEADAWPLFAALKRLLVV